MTAKVFALRALEFDVFGSLAGDILVTLWMPKHLPGQHAKSCLSAVSTHQLCDTFTEYGLLMHCHAGEVQ